VNYCSVVGLNLLHCRYSPISHGIFDPETEEYQTVWRVMSGFTDSLHRDLNSFDIFFEIFWYANHVFMVEDAESSRLCQLTLNTELLKYPRHFV
jgi:hypothetical protein